jgi:hypothetical protein
MRTSTATIGIRGTAYSATQTDNGLNVFVSEGAISVTNQDGSIVVEAGQCATVRSPQAMPEVSVDKVPLPVPEAPQQMIEQQTTGPTVIFNEQINNIGHSTVFEQSSSPESPPFQDQPPP